MDETQDNIAYAVHLGAEHRRLHEVLQRIAREWPIAGEPVSVRGTSQSLDALKQLRQELVSHFREEEEGGCLEEAACHCPNLGNEADRIEHEHAPLLAGMDDIISRLQDAQEALNAAISVRQQFDTFAQSLCAHEQAENLLLESAFGIPVD